MAANSGSARSGALTIAGQIFTVSQAAAPADLYLQNLTLMSGVSLYQAPNSVVAENNVLIGASANLTFEAGNFVRLGPGFQATAGSAATTFHARIQ